MSSYAVLTFDCYGTLIDWEAGIAAAFIAAAPNTAGVDTAAVLSTYADVEPAVQRERFRPYREVLAHTAVEVARRLGWSLTLEQAAFLPNSLARWPVFPDTNAALTRLHEAGFELGILSNVDDDLLAATARQFAVPFDFTITAQHVRSYKPAPAHFEAARSRIGDRGWLHVAQSWFHDVQPACAAGISVAWVNRMGEPVPPDATPVTVVSDLEAFAAWIGT
jgi:2-haloacid dehalogenase/putative hydrolase of the HAD superfamily